MIHYRDKTFCSAICAFTACHRNRVNVPADTNGLPVAYGDFSATCPQFEAPIRPANSNSAILLKERGV